MTHPENENTTQKNTNNSEDFETMLDESMKNLNTNLKKGDVVTGTISSINESQIIISIGVKQDAYAEIGDYLEDGKLQYKIGDEIKGFIVKMNDHQIVISKSLNRSHGNKILVKEAFAKKIPVKGKVTEAVKGGYSVDVFSIRAFCPVSHIDLNINEKPETFVGNTYDFEIIEYERNNIIVSRKNLLIQEINEKKEKFFSNTNVGDILTGTVSRLTNFGAFIDLGGVEGLLHISEFSWAHVAKADEFLNVGDEIEVKVIALEGDRISLSIKALQENPMKAAFEKYHEGDMVTCKVLRHENFGSFVELEEGVEGLIPISLMSNKRIQRPSEVLDLDQDVEARIIKLDPKNFKISLSLKEPVVDVWDTQADTLKQGQEVKGTIENVSEHGIFVKIDNGITGLIPSSKVKRAKLNYTSQNQNEEIDVRISSIDTKAKRLSLEPLDMPAFEPRKKDEKRDNRRQSKDYTQDSDWQKYATGYQSVPEDNPFKDL
ncbi:MAG: S1 RNA-binding domain-containing protein [Candidatus Cloacimonetes bacterium]|nr:S1 RNA-binding domain-containing protein [Candidatus Cloacimonadota bacterium]MDD4155616.1 S1 RNA-binding domain-containing protein [Candidatus Cloacimonadota bacterium]